MRHFGLTNGLRSAGGRHEARSHHAHDTQRDLNSYPVPSQSILHREDVPHSPLNVGALYFFVISLSAVLVALVVGYAVLRFVGL